MVKMLANIKLSCMFTVTNETSIQQRSNVKKSKQQHVTVQSSAMSKTHTAL